jgi:hypothetical protein
MLVYKRLKGHDEYSASENIYPETGRTFFKQLSEHEKAQGVEFL